MAGTGLTGSTVILWHAVKDFSVSLARSNAEIVRVTGKSDWRLAVKTAILATAAGKPLEWQMEKPGGKGNAAFVNWLSDAFKIRIEETIRKELIEKDKKWTKRIQNHNTIGILFLILEMKPYCS